MNSVAANGLKKCIDILNITVRKSKQTIITSDIKNTTKTNNFAWCHRSHKTHKTNDFT